MGSGSTAARPIRGRSSRATTTRCWRRSPPGRRRRRWRSRGSTGRCASSASAGVSTNIAFVENLLKHPTFLDNSYTTKFIDTTPELFQFSARRDRATKILTYIADITVNGHPGDRRAAEAAGRGAAAEAAGGAARRAAAGDAAAPGGEGREGGRRLDAGAGAAARHRHHDARRPPEPARDADALLRHDPGGAGLCADAAAALQRRVLGRARPSTSPTASCRNARGSGCATCARAMPNLMTQMLLRASNGVGYTNYPDNVVQTFVAQAATSGVDVFRVFDSLNWVENMRVAMDAVIDSGKICEAAICYTGDLLDPARSKYDLKYYVAHGEGAARRRRACPRAQGHGRASEAVGRLHAGQDAEGGGRAADPLPHPRHQRRSRRRASSRRRAPGSMRSTRRWTASRATPRSPASGRSSRRWQRTERDTGLDIEAIRQISDYWEAVRTQYAAFEAGLKAPASEVYLHEMPGGQFTNLKAQARSMGLEERWHEVAHMYAEVNRMFGDIVKVTPLVEGRGRHGADDGGAGADPGAGRGSGRSRWPSRRASST